MFKKPFKKIEITYQSIKNKKVFKEEKSSKQLKVVKDKLSKQDVKIILKKERIYSPALEKKVKDISGIKNKFDLFKKQIPNIKTIDLSAKISVPIIKSEKISNPKYLSYNESIRNKIEQKAYTYVRHPDFEAGEVYITFVLKSNGILQDIKIIESRTSANSYLRDVGLRSVQESSPFLEFPKDLNYPELTFNVVISFEVK